MPTNRNRRQRKNNKLIVPPALIYYFETGDQDQSAFDECDRYNEWINFDAGNGQDAIDYWNVCKETLLADWIKEKPLTRPWGWWILERNVGSVFGCFRVPSGIEQLTYLIDHDLLTVVEKAYLKKHPESNDRKLL
jgi:hypothetical protein